MQLLPIHRSLEVLSDLLPHWAPFLHNIAKHTKQPVAELFGMVKRFEVQPILIWDEVELKAVALLGVRYHMRGRDKIAELIWGSGKGMTRWRHVLPELEKYLVEHEGVKELRPICPPGWSRFLSKHGYKISHYMMEKELHHGKQ